jgi:hypothetical protein
MKIQLTCLLLALFVLSCKKNKEDKDPGVKPVGARFMVTGSMQDFSNATYTGYYPQEITLAKVNDTQGRMEPAELGIPGHIILIGGSKSYYSNFAPVITLDLTTNKVTSIINHYGQPSGNGRSCTLDPSGINAWDPATKTIKIKYWMDEPSVYTPHRVAFNETWTYME